MLSSHTPIVEISKKLGMSRNFIYKQIKKYNLIRPVPKKILNENFFQNIKTERQAYWLGFIMADGCIFKTSTSYRLDIGLKKEDFKHLQKFHKDIDSIRDVKIYPYKCYSFHTSKKLCKDLISLGCTERKSLTLEYPNIPKILERHLIRGYFDGDGCIYFRKPRGNYVSPVISIVGNIDFLQGLRKNLKMDEYKMTLKIRHPERNNNIRYFVLSGKKACEKFFKIVYADATVYLERKYLKFTTI